MNPSNPITRAKKKQAYSFFQNNQLSEAKVLFAQICKIDRGDCDAWNMLGAVHGMLEEFADAEVCCRKVIALRPDAVGTYNNLGNALKFQGKLEEAEATYRQALRLQPNYAEAYNNLGNLLKDKGVVADAENCYRQALHLQPAYAEAHNNLAALLRSQGKTDEALARYGYALELNPAYVDARYNLGTLLYQKGQRDDAQATFQQVIQYQPRHVGALTDLGSIFHEKGEAAEAETLFRRVLDIDPTAERARYLLAMLGVEEAPSQSPGEYVKQLFDGYADKFDQHLVSELQYQTPDLLYTAVTREIGSCIGRQLSVLDFGCGTGLCGPLFREAAHTLIGVDLSPKMLEKARERAVYDELVEGDVTAIVSSPGKAYDLILAADVFVYIGDLVQVFSVCRSALSPGGMFAFSIETSNEGDTYVLRSSGRYAHSVEYIRRLAAEAGLSERSMESVVLRREAGRPMMGNIFILQI